MKTRISRNIGLFLILFIVGLFINTKPCLAASTEIKINTDKNEVTVGDEIIVYFNLSSDSQIGDFEAYLNYDDEILEYKEGPSFISGGIGLLKITDSNVMEGSDTRKYAIKFQTLRSGSAEISFQDPVMVFDFDTGMEMSVSHNVLNIEVKSAKTASDNAFLKSLKISPAQLEPEFQKETYQYSTSVSYETEKLIISAIPEDEKARVSISGNDFLKEGENKISITVLAESGVNIEYTIDVIREAKKEEHTETDEKPIEEIKSFFEVVKEGNNIYAIYSGKYELLVPGDHVSIPKGYIKTKAILSDISVTVFSRENDLDNDFLLIYARNEQGEEGFYQYDRKEKTLQRYEAGERRDYQNSNEGPSIEEIMTSQMYKKNLRKANFMIGLLSVVCILLLFALLGLGAQFLKRKGRRRR